MSYKNFIAFVVTPLKIIEFCVTLEGYDKGFYGIIIRRLQDLDSDDLNSYTRPTVGMEREEIKYNLSTFLVAEYGSKMLANWNKM